MAIGVWNHLCLGRNYEPGLTKATCIVDLALCYIHAVIARSFAGKADSQGVIGGHELLYLYTITEHRPFHLGFILAEFLTHQGQYTRLSSIFAGLYTTYLIRVMGLFGELEGQVIVGSMTSLGMDTQIHWDGYATGVTICTHSSS